MKYQKFTNLSKLLILLSFSGILTAQINLDTSSTNENYADQEQNLTDAQRVYADNYIHDPYLQDELEKACEQVGSDVCTADPNSVKQDQAMIADLAANLLAAFGLTGGNMIVEASSTDASKVSDAKPPAEGAEAAGSEGVKDYCNYIPVGVQMTAKVSQMTDQSEIEAAIQQAEQQTQTRQKESLYALARAHDGHAKSINIQRIGWTSTAACYTGMIAANFGADITGQTYFKLAASVVLGKIYNDKYSAHKDYSKQAKKIAEMLPGKGACNPLTEPNCYCAQESTKNDATYCVSESLKVRQQALADPNLAVIPCTTGTITANDYKVSQSTNCNHEALKEALKIKSSKNNPVSTAGALNTLYDVFNGTYNEPKINTSAVKQLAIAEKFMKDNKDKIPGLSKGQILTAKQKQMAKKFKELGLPDNVAAKFATLKPSAADKNKVAALSGNLRSTGTTAAVNERKGGVSYSGTVTQTGKLFNNQKSDSDKKSNKFDFLKKNKKLDPKGGVVYEKFAQAAEAKAQIRKDTGKPIFEIISYRYQMSGWNKLGVVE